jgi:hypothetical protein
MRGVTVYLKPAKRRRALHLARRLLEPGQARARRLDVAEVAVAVAHRSAERAGAVPADHHRRMRLLHRPQLGVGAGEGDEAAGIGRLRLRPQGDDGLEVLVAARSLGGNGTPRARHSGSR